MNFRDFCEKINVFAHFFKKRMKKCTFFEIKRKKRAKTKIFKKNAKTYRKVSQKKLLAPNHFSNALKHSGNSKNSKGYWEATGSQ